MQSPSHAKNEISIMVEQTAPPTLERSSSEYELFSPPNIFKLDQCLDTKPLKPKPTKRIVPNTYPDLASSVEWLSDFDWFSKLESPLLAELEKAPIDDQVAKLISFDETLVVSRKHDDIKEDSAKKDFGAAPKSHVLLDSDRLEPVGGMSFSIEAVGDKFLVNLASQFSYDPEQAAQNSIAATYTNSLRILHEKRRETLYSKDHRKEKQLDADANPRKRTIELVSLNKEYTACKERRGQLMLDESPNFLLEGGNLVLMRYLVYQKFIGKIETLTMMITGEICESTLICSRKSDIIVNGRKVNVYKLRRVLKRSHHEPDICIAVFLETGHLLRQTWHGCPFVVHINPMEDVLRLLSLSMPNTTVDDRWRDDTKLLAEFMDMRNDRAVDMRQFVRESPRVMAIIRDYLYCLLQNKPSNVVEYTAKYFGDPSSEQLYEIVSDVEKDDFTDSIIWE